MPEKTANPSLAAGAGAAYFDKIYIDRRFTDPGHSDYQNSLVVDHILNQPGMNTSEDGPPKVEFVENAGEMLRLSSRQRYDFGAGKKILLVHPHAGRFIHACPGSDGMTCCHYFVINLGQNCVYDCHYCYLQTFLSNPLTTIHGNWKDLKAELDQKLENPRFHYRVGTGEYADSLALDRFSGYSRLLIEDFARRENASLELKTKSVNIDHLLDADHRGNTVMAWSLNPPFVVATIEDYTANLEERLSAARQAEAAGYRLAFHFDPMVWYENWERDYRQTVEMIFDYVRADSIAWISLGTFRYSPGMREMLRGRFPGDLLLRAEMVKGGDGKERYIKPLRQKMYSKMREWFQAVDKKLFTYLCMETRVMWEQVYDFDPGSRKNLDTLFEERRQYMLKPGSS